MRTTHFTLTARDVQLHTTHVLQSHLKLRDHGPKCRASTLWAVLCWAAARLASIAAACANLVNAPCDQATRDALLATLPPLLELQRRINHALADGLPQKLRRRRQPLAVDLVLIPYHGQPFDDPDEVYRGQRKSGTSHFHAYATAYAIVKGQRWTLALTAVHKGEAMKEVLARLLRRAAACGVRPRYVLLDRGFYSVEVIRYLQAARYPFVMPVVRRGRKPKHPHGPSGTWVFFTWRRSGRGHHTLSDLKGRRHATVSIGVYCRRVGKQRHPQVLVYAYWGLQPRSLAWLRETYRSRFAIETTYRQLHQARIRTSTRQPLLRLLFVAVALILRNIWVWLHWEALARKRRGARLVDLDQLCFRSMLVWLQHQVEALLGNCDAVHTERSVPQWLVTGGCQ